MVNAASPFGPWQVFMMCFIAMATPIKILMMSGEIKRNWKAVYQLNILLKVITNSISCEYITSYVVTVLITLNSAYKIHALICILL